MFLLSKIVIVGVVTVVVLFYLDWTFYPTVTYIASFFSLGMFVTCE